MDSLSCYWRYEILIMTDNSTIKILNSYLYLMYYSSVFLCVLQPKETWRKFCIDYPLWRHIQKFRINFLLFNGIALHRINIQISHDTRS